MCPRNVTSSIVDDTNAGVAYIRNLAGEVMFADTGEVAGWLAGTPYPAGAPRIRIWARNPAGTLRPPPAVACWVVPAQQLMLVPPGTLPRFAAAAREHGLGVQQEDDGTLLVTGGDGTRDTHVAVLDGELPPKAQPRWWLGQRREWVEWNAAGRRHNAGNPDFTEGNTYRDRQWEPITEEQRETVAQMIEHVRVNGGRKVTVAKVTEATGLGPTRARALLHEAGLRQLTDEELAAAVREIITTVGQARPVRGKRKPVVVVPVAEVMRLGVSRERAAAAITAAGAATRAPRPAPDTQLLRPDDQGRVRATKVAAAYGLDPSAITRLVERQKLTRVGGEEGGRGKPLLLDLEQVRAVLG